MTIHTGEAYLEVPKTYELQLEAPAWVRHTGRATMNSQSKRFNYWNQHGMG